MNHELMRRYRRESGQPMTEYVLGAVGALAPSVSSGARTVAGEACHVTGFWTLASGALGLTVHARVPVTSDETDGNGRPLAGKTILVNVAASDVLTVVPNTRAWSCPDVLCPNETPSNDPATGDVILAPLTVCWMVRHEDGTVSHGWDGPADAAAAAHTYATAPDGAIFDARPGMARVELLDGWTLGA